MDTSFLPLLSGQLLPSLGIQTFAMHLGWGLVLSAMVAFLLRPFPWVLRLTGVGIIAASHLLPGEWGPAWWLGLAFQSPSLTLQGISLLYLIRMWKLRRIAPTETIDTTAYARWPTALLLIAAIIGWIFVADMLALLDVQLYAMGFTPYAVLVSLGIAVACELWSRYADHPARLQKYRDLAAIIVVAMAIHLLIRLPTGNAWDALMDPWLWLGAQALWLSRVIAWLVLRARVWGREASARISTALGRER